MITRPVYAPPPHPHPPTHPPTLMNKVQYLYDRGFGSVRLTSTIDGGTCPGLTCSGKLPSTFYISNVRACCS